MRYYLLLISLIINTLMAISTGFNPINIKCESTNQDKAEKKAKRLLYDNIQKQIIDNKILLFGTYGLYFKESDQFLNYTELQNQAISKYPLQISFINSKNEYLAEYKVSDAALSDQMKILSIQHYDKAVEYYTLFQNENDKSFEKDIFILKALDELIQCSILSDSALVQSKNIIAEVESFLSNVSIIVPNSNVKAGQSQNKYTFKAYYYNKLINVPVKQLCIILKFSDHIEKIYTDNAGIATISLNSSKSQDMSYIVDFSSLFNGLDCNNEQFIKYLFNKKLSNLSGNINYVKINKLKLSIIHEGFSEAQIAPITKKLLQRGYSREFNPDNADYQCTLKTNIIDERTLSYGVFYVKGKLSLEITDKNSEVIERVYGNEFEIFSNKSILDAENKLKIKILKDITNVISRL